MNAKKFAIACIAVFAFIFVFEILFHGIFMQSSYEQTANLWRTEEAMNSNRVWLILGQLIISIGFVALFTKAFKRGGLPEGIIFGLLLAIAYSGHYLISYAVSPYPFNLVISWIIGTVIELILAGIIVAFIYKSKHNPV